MNYGKIKLNINFIYFLFFYIIIKLRIKFTLSQINDIYEVHDITGEEGSKLVDVVDYHNLKLIVSALGNIYTGIPPTKKSQSNAKLNKYSSVATINENFLLASCLDDSLLTKININTGEHTSLLSYSDILTPNELSVPEKCCSLSVFDNFVFIGYSQLNTSNSLITNIAIKITIKNKDDNNGPILDTSSEKKFFIFPDQYTNTVAIRQIGCEAVYIKNYATDYRLICLYENVVSKNYYVFAFVINSNFNGLDYNGQESQLFKVTSVSGFRLLRLDNYNVRAIMRKSIYDLYLEYESGVVKMITNKANSNLLAYSATRDLYDYSNNFVVSSEVYKKNFMGHKNFYYFTINKASSNNYYKIYDYNEGLVSKLFCYYEEESDLLIVIYEGKISIKYFILQNHKDLFGIGSYSQTIKIKSYEKKSYNIADLFDFSNYGNLQVQTKRIYNATYSPYELNFGGDNFKIFLVDDNGQLTTEQSRHNWYEYVFALIDNTNNYARLFVLPSVNFYVETCQDGCTNSCLEDYYKCDNCKNESYTEIRGANDNMCYPINKRIEGYLYDSNTRMFEECYSTCQFCTKRSEESSSSEHNCESCKEGYSPSYKFLGNCYKMNENEINLSKKVNSIIDESFTLVDICSSYKINLNAECVDLCPSYTFTIKNIILTELTIDINDYIKENLIPPKYLFNGICYESCPFLTLPDDTNNKCICENAYHIDNGLLICYEEDYCLNDSYKYYLNDTRQCISASNKECPSGYYQFNFYCYANACPSDTTTNSNKCISNFDYCYINEKFQNICSDTKNEEYIYYFKETHQYLKSCEESLIYTIYEAKPYLYNQTCYLECPENTNKNDTSNTCECQYYIYYLENNNYICYSEDEKCGDKIPVIDLKICLNNFDECKEKNYKIFNNECYSEECPPNTKPDSNDNHLCICSYHYYNYSNNNTLNCFDESISCENNNYLYNNPNNNECYDSLEDCFEKGNLFYFNNHCYKNGCPSGTIPLSSENETVQNYFKDQLSLDNNLKNKICICDIINFNLNWNKTIGNEMACLESCPEGFEPESLTHRCIEKCSPEKHYNFNNECYIEGCPVGTRLNSTINENEKKICVCQSFYYFDENNDMICLDDIQSSLSSLPEIEVIDSTENNIKTSEMIYQEEYDNNPEECLSILDNEDLLQCPIDSCLTLNDIDLKCCIQKKENYFAFNDICFIDFNEIINNLKNLSEKEIVLYHKNVTLSIYTTKTAISFMYKYQNLSIIFLNECEDLLLRYYNLSNDTIIYIIGIDSPYKNKSYVTNAYNYGAFLENGFQLDHINICKDVKITISSPIINTDSAKVDDALYFSSLGYDIYDENDTFYTKYCSSASINGNDITLNDRKNDFYPSNYTLCNVSCEYNYINFTSERFICECDLKYNFSEFYYNFNNINENVDKGVSYLDYFISLFNYKIIPCYELLLNRKNYKKNIGFYISSITIFICLITMIIYFIYGMKKINKEILNGIPNKYKLKKILIKKKRSKMKIENIKDNNDYKVNNNININFIYINQGNNNPPIKKILKTQEDLKENNKKKNLMRKLKIKEKDKIENKENNKNKKENDNITKTLKGKRVIIKIDPKTKNNKTFINNTKGNNKKKIMKTDDRNKFKFTAKKLNTSGSLLSVNNSSKNNICKSNVERNRFLELSLFSDDSSVDMKEINNVPYTQALRIDKRDFFEILFSIIAKEIKILNIFYYKNPYIHFSLMISILLFQSLLDLTLNCLLYTENYISEKYKNGELKLMTSIFLSLMSNIITNIISYFFDMLINFSELLEIIINNAVQKQFYFLFISKFKKYVKLKLISLYVIEYMVYLFMFYYLTIFCIVYSKTQISFLINYIIGLIISLLISFFIALIATSLRYISLKLEIKSFYNTSKYILEKF